MANIRSDSSGTLKTTISLGRTPTIVHSGPFYLIKEPPESSKLTGSMNLIAHHRLSNSYTKLSSKKKNELGSFLHNITDVDIPPARTEALGGSTLQSLLDIRITIKEILPLNATQLIGFRLHPGQLPLQYRLFSQTTHKKHKKHRKSKRSHPNEAAQSSSEVPMDIGDQSIISSDRKAKKQSKKDKKKKKDKDKEKHKKDQSPSTRIK